MNRKQALAELIAKVEAGEIANCAWSYWTHEAVKVGLAGFSPSWVYQIMERGSLDAAKALHDAELPMWDATILVGQDGNPSRAIVRPYTPQSGNPSSVTVWNADPARAWLLAILRALHAQEAAE